MFVMSTHPRSACSLSLAIAPADSHYDVRLGELRGRNLPTSLRRFVWERQLLPDPSEADQIEAAVAATMKTLDISTVDDSPIAPMLARWIPQVMYARLPCPARARECFRLCACVRA